MKKLLSALVLCFVASCGASRDLAKTLRFSDSSRAITVEQIKFQDLKKMKRGDACTYHLFYIIPLYGDGSIITAAHNGDINNVQLIGETGMWYGGVVNKNCTVVFGDSDDIINQFKAPSTDQAKGLKQKK